MSLIYSSNGAIGVFPSRPTVTSYRPIPSGALIFVSVIFPGGLTIHDIKIFTKGSTRYVAPPSQAYQRKNGQTEYKDILEFSTAEAREEFQRQVLAAADYFIKGDQHHE